MKLFQSKISNHLKPYLVAIILLLQAQSLYVAWDLSRTIETRNQNYLNESITLAASIIDLRVNSVVNSLSKLGQEALELFEDPNVPNARADELLARYKALWHYNALYIVGRDGSRLTHADYWGENEKELVREALASGRPRLGRCSETHAISYAIPVKKAGKVQFVLVCSRSSEQAYSLLDVPIFNGSGLALFFDHKGQVLTRRWRSATEELKRSVDFISLDLTLIPEKLGDFYDLTHSDVSRFTASDGKSWLIVQKANSDIGFTVAFAAPESMLLLGIPSLNWQNIVTHLVACLLIAFLIFDLYFLQKHFRKQLHQAATIDPLTRGPNFASFSQILEKQLAFTSDPYALVSIDINKFKLINDEYGAEKANELLRLIYRILSGHRQPGEACARVSADVFLCLLHMPDHASLRERVSAMLAEIMRRKHSLGILHKHGLAAGVYVVEDHAMPAVMITDHASLAREVSKKSVGTPVTFFNEAVADGLRQETELLNTFGESLQNGDFCIQLQPKVNIRTDTVAGAEALVRWRHPQRGFIRPDHFLPALEKAGRIVELDLWVFETVCALLARWKKEGREIIPIAVNLSRMHLQNEHFLTSYLQLIQKYDIIPQWIELELTETLFMQDEESVSHSFSAIRSHGLRCAIDDFGTGYSSLSMLKNSNVDTVKLDRSFFTEPVLSEQTRSVVRSLTQLAEALGLTCVAEGVEERSAVEFLLSTDCSLVQGYVFSRPLDVPDFEAYAFNEEGRRRLLGSVAFDSVREAMSEGVSQRTQQVRDMLDCLRSTGVYVVKKNSRELLFCNNFLREHTSGPVREGMFCHEVWSDLCIPGKCPALAYASGDTEPRIAPQSVFGGPAKVSVSETLWDSYIPAYVVSLSPLFSQISGEEEEEEEEEVRHLRTQAALWRRKAQEDDLTKLLTKAQFKEEVEKRIATGRQGALVFVDLDGFKMINDTYGHQMGDLVLKNTAARLRLSFRSDDIIGRFGGDEFQVYLSGLDCQTLLDQRLRALESLLRQPHVSDHVSCAISASLGVACFPGDASTYPDLEARADAALYEAKQRGKDQHVYYSEIKEEVKKKEERRKAERQS